MTSNSEEMWGDETPEPCMELLEPEEILPDPPTGSPSIPPPIPHLPLYTPPPSSVLLMGGEASCRNPFEHESFDTPTGHRSTFGHFPGESVPCTICTPPRKTDLTC